MTKSTCLDEVVEYVVTKEVAKKIRDFFSAYNDFTGVTVVSGYQAFFGSGKSHLLKILSYALGEPRVQWVQT
ncbi:MAG: hypothetical protein MZV63_04305 [Marinilabiliales bacterium]|nr:hypothetical protein [Marinilabiliales bacterium]